MLQLSGTSTPLDQVWVALDLETTGLSPEEDEIIEVGAVRFQGRRVLDTFQTLVDPGRLLGEFVTGYTGIRQEEVERAPPFSAVADGLARFIGASPLVGHSLGFDLAFLSRRGLGLTNPRADTWDLAFVLMPTFPDYSLVRLAQELGVEHPRPHRALDDALATMGVFLRLLDMARGLDPYALAEMARLASRSGWVLDYLLRGLVSSQAGLRSGRLSVDATGVDTEGLRRRLKAGPSLKPARRVSPVDVARVDAFFSPDGPLARAMPGYELRHQQLAMARAVTQALNEGGRLLVEAGTGVGKSLAYLLPAALYALANGKRVVVSTNTINLQEQLLSKDLPLLQEALETWGEPGADGLRYAALKGRANYLCLRRWQSLRAKEGLTEGEARLLSKTLLWLRNTATGDRSELNLYPRRLAGPWERLSAQGALDCPRGDAPCFLRAARERAAAAHLVVVNHALLISDLVTDGSLIPSYDILIVDEAHHLEDEATRRLGWEVHQNRMDELLQALAGERGILREVVLAVGRSASAPDRRRAVEEATARAVEAVARAADALNALFGLLRTLALEESEEREPPLDLRITTGVRAQPLWSDLEMTWEPADEALGEVDRAVERVARAVEGLEEAQIPNYEGILMELSALGQQTAELRAELTEFIPHPQEDKVYWLSLSGRDAAVSLHAAPLHVGPLLEDLLFSQKQAVVMTSATLSAGDSFDHVVDRTGFHGARQVLLDSPFDYRRAALICVPQDIPEPTARGYGEAVVRAIAEAAKAAGGRSMALFTSHAALREASRALRPLLAPLDIRVLAQEIDGTPHQVLSRFLEDPRAVILGTASFWEGVDLAGDVLQVLLVARLPFSVPTDPIFAARSEMYERPFVEYALPQAILRLRQGFGRLIRSQGDRGVAVFLDRRVLTRSYGRQFLDSLPRATVRPCRLASLASQIRRWLAG